MLVNNIFVDNKTGEEWVIDKALLEIVGSFRNIVLLVSSRKLYSFSGMTGCTHRVVFNGELVAGDWRLEPGVGLGCAPHMHIMFHYTGNDSVARTHRYEQLAGTAAWNRVTDNRIFIEITNLQAANLAFSKLSPFNTPCCTPPTLTGHFRQMQQEERRVTCHGTTGQPMSMGVRPVGGGATSSSSSSLPQANTFGTPASTTTHSLNGNFGLNTEIVGGSWRLA